MAKTNRKPVNLEKLTKKKLTKMKPAKLQRVLGQLMTPMTPEKMAIVKEHLGPALRQKTDAERMEKKFGRVHPNPFLGSDLGETLGKSEQALAAVQQATTGEGDGCFLSTEESYGIFQILEGVRYALVLEAQKLELSTQNRNDETDCLNSPTSKVANFPS